MYMYVNEQFSQSNGVLDEYQNRYLQKEPEYQAEISPIKLLFTMFTTELSQCNVTAKYFSTCTSCTKQEVANNGNKLWIQQLQHGSSIIYSSNAVYSSSSSSSLS